MKALICDKEVEVKSASEFLSNGEKILRVNIVNETLATIETLVKSDEFGGAAITTKSGEPVNFGMDYTEFNSLMRVVTDMSDELVLELGAGDSLLNGEE